MRRDGHCWRATVLVFAVVLGVDSPSLADRLVRSVTPGGGSVAATSESYVLSGALGQPMAGRCASEGYVLSCGFWGVPLATVPVAVGPAVLPGAFRLLGVQPNPSASEAAIVFDLPAMARVEVRVFDVEGRSIRTLAMERRESGRHLLRWDGRNDAGAPAAAGVYMVRVTTGSDRAITRFIRLR